MLRTSVQHKIRVGTRGSRLAIAQVEEIQSALEQKGRRLDFEIVRYETKGDKDKKTPLTQNPADDFFTDTLDDALLDKKIDIAVHSAKDLPHHLREGLSIFALTASPDETDAFAGKVKFERLASGAKVGTSSLLRKQSIKALNPNLEVIDIRGTIEERLQLIDQGICDGIIAATVALKRLGLEDRIQTIMPWEAAPLQGQLAVVGREEDEHLKSLFSVIDVRRTYGPVYLIGAGPGDPDLITLKGARLLKSADCVFYDYLTPKELLRYAPKAEKIYAGKRKGQHTLPQSELSKLLKQKAMEGKTVVRLKGGDPLIFGRGADEIEYLRAYHIHVEVVPGVSSATAIPSSLGIPLTARGISSSVAFISGYEENERETTPRPVKIPDVDTVVFLMGLTKLDTIVQSLRQAGWKDTTPVAVISKGTCPDQKIVDGTLQDIQHKVLQEDLQPPALIIAGETVKFWKKNQHHEPHVLYTGTHPEKFKSLGRIVHFPMIAISEAPLPQERIQVLMKNLAGYDMILFTSRFAVRYFFEILKRQKYDILNLRGKDFVVIGQNTATALREYQLKPRLVAGIETSRGLFQDMTKMFDLKSKRILFPRSSLPNPYLKEALTKSGARVDELAVYQNTKPEKRALPGIDISQVLFTSPSTVRNFLQDYQRIPGHWRILSKGPLTRQSLKDAGYESEVLADA